MDDAVNFRLDYIAGQFYRNHPRIGFPPGFEIPKQVVRLQYRNVQILHKVFIILAAESQTDLKGVDDCGDNAFPVFIKVLFNCT